jgi:type I restriction enzyme S subunit
MNNNNENKLVPVYRFPEFQNAGKWEVKRLGEVLDYERPDKYIVNSENYTDIGVPVLTANKSFILGYTNEIEGACGDLPVIIFDDFTTDKKYVNFPFKVKSSAIKILRPKVKNNLKFIFELLSMIKFEAKEHKRYYISTYQNLAIPLPSLPEQQKIASCLSSLDEVITGEQQKLELLKQHKKGLLQNLFPQEGETVPKLRFPEFKDAGEWEYCYGNELFESIVNKNHNSDLPILAITQEQGAVPREMIDYYISVTKQSVKNYKIVEIGDFIISLRSFQGGIEFSKYRGLCSPAYIILRKKVSLENHFYRHYFKTFTFIHDLNKNIEGIRDGKLITYRQFSEIKIPFPSLPEQQKIAACLSSLDDLINAQQQKIELLKQHKKGLLQGLFPNMNEQHG